MGLQRLKPYVLTLFFSNRYSYAQIMHTPAGHIVAAASTIEKALRTELPSTSDKQAWAHDSRLLCAY
jgi:ribosomal protein L18